MREVPVPENGSHRLRDLAYCLSVRECVRRLLPHPETLCGQKRQTFPVVNREAHRGRDRDLRTEAVSRVHRRFKRSAGSNQEWSRGSSRSGGRRRLLAAVLIDTVRI